MTYWKITHSQLDDWSLRAWLDFVAANSATVTLKSKCLSEGYHLNWNIICFGDIDVSSLSRWNRSIKSKAQNSTRIFLGSILQCLLNLRFSNVSSWLHVLYIVLCGREREGLDPIRIWISLTFFMYEVPLHAVTTLSRSDPFWHSAWNTAWGSTSINCILTVIGSFTVLSHDIGKMQWFG